MWIVVPCLIQDVSLASSSVPIMGTASRRDSDVMGGLIVETAPMKLIAVSDRSSAVQEKTLAASFLSPAPHSSHPEFCLVG